MMDAFADAAVNAGCALFGIAVSWGILKTKTEQVKEDSLQLKGDIKTLYTRIEAMDSKFVTNELFKYVITEIKENQKSMASDIKEILAVIRDHS